MISEDLMLFSLSYCLFSYINNSNFISSFTSMCFFTLSERTANSYFLYTVYVRKRVSVYYINRFYKIK